MSTAPSETITLLDLPTREPVTGWSLNPWKTRLYLNYKNLPYTTRWTNYPDIAPTVSPHVAPHPEGTSFKPYTIPTVILKDGTYVMESLVIAEKLNELYPTPELKIRTPLLDEVIKLTRQISAGSAPEFIGRVPERLLGERDQKYWAENHAKRRGVPVEEYIAQNGGKKATEAVAEPVRAMGQLLKKEGGPFFEGEQVTYPDFIWVALLLFLERVGSDAFDTIIVEERETHLRLLEEVKRRGWAKRDDH